MLTLGSVAEARGPASYRADHPDYPEAYVSPEVRMERAARIRNAAANLGMTNAALLGGIGQVETGFAHCWSEATWACQGPPSESCDGGPVIAGAYDGPCSDEQGGLGMFQFDAGTFDDTIGVYGPEIVTMEGNVAAVIPFLLTRIVQSVEGVDTEAEAMAWMNSIPIVDGDPLFQEWGYFVAWRYNGCKGCAQKIENYKNGALLVYEEFGPDFWNVSEDYSCGWIPPDGRTIEEDDDCYQGMGPSQYWRDVLSGHGGTLVWTKATDSEEASNYGIWNLDFEAAGDYELMVYSDGGEYGQSTQAAYKVTHADGTELVVVDQSATEGWISLGVFHFEEGRGQQVQLDDNTGEEWAADPGGVKLMFDALRVVPDKDPSQPEDPQDPGEDPLEEDPSDSTGGLIGGCSTSGGSGANWLFIALAFLALRRRRS